MERRALIIVALLATPAAAEPPRWDFGWSFAGGAEVMGNRTFAQVGAAAWLRYRATQHLAIEARGELLGTSADGDTDNPILGDTTRGTAEVAYRVAGEDWAELWVDAGAGRELTAWERGTLGRELVYVGVDGLVGVVFDDDRAIRRIKRLGNSLGVRLQLAPGLEPKALAFACRQCAPPPRPGVDVGVLVTYGLTFGR